MRHPLIAFTFWTTLLAAPAAAQRPDSAAFIIRLGTDTVAVERYVRTGNRLLAEAVQRSPITTVHKLGYAFGPDGRVIGMEWWQQGPGAAPPVASRRISLAGDTVVIESTQGSNTRTQRVRAGGAIPIIGPFYTPYELAIMSRVAARRGGDRVVLLAGADTVSIPVTFVGDDSVALTNQFGEPMRAHIDRTGHLLHLHTPAYTTVERLPWVDFDRLVREFTARDEVGKGMGVLSPRQTYRTRVGTANIWLDYSRPGMRGRPIWGALVPWNAVWRTGANDAAHFSTDRTVELGDLALQPGTYTLFLRPGQVAWKLIVNRQTGMSGLERDSTQDIGSVNLNVETMPQPQEQFTITVSNNSGAGTLAFMWDRTRASVPMRVPAQVGPGGLRQLNWLVGTWKGSGGGYAGFYERYHFENDSTLVGESFSDSTFSKVTETSVYELRNGRITNRGKYIASALSNDAVTFVTLGTGRNSFTWRRVGPNEWSAVLDNPAANTAAARSVTYRMVRIH